MVHVVEACEDRKLVSIRRQAVPKEGEANMGMSKVRLMMVV